MSTSERAPLHREEEKRSQHFLLAHVTIISRTWGILTVIVMWISGVVLVDRHSKNYTGYYLIAASIIVTFFEITWILDKLACCVREGCCCTVWAIFLWVDNWKKCVLYLALSVPLFLEGMRKVLSMVAGFLLVILAFIYLIKTFRRYVTVSYETREKRVVSSTSSGWQVTRHEIATQTDQNNDSTISTATVNESNFPNSNIP